jgi:ABC-type branched-subunit amino acid transport system substrate-binding protein
LATRSVVPPVRCPVINVANRREGARTRLLLPRAMTSSLERSCHARWCTLIPILMPAADRDTATANATEREPHDRLRTFASRAWPGRGAGGGICRAGATQRYRRALTCRDRVVAGARAMGVLTMRILRARVTRRWLVTACCAVVLVALVGGLVLAVIGPGRTSGRADGPNAYTVALALPLTGEIAAEGQDVAAAMRLYVGQLNTAGGINGHPINLQIFDDRSDAQYAPQVAQQIVDSRALVVIGHFTSALSLAAGPVYKQNGIAAVTGTATADSVTQDNPFYYRTTFTNTGYAAQLGGYVATQLGAKRASIIQSNDPYGQTIAEGFAQGFPGTIVKTWRYDDAPDKREASRKQILDDLAGTPDAGTVLFAMLANPGSKFVIDMKRRGMNAPIVGSDSVGNPLFTDLFANEPEEKARPGYFVNGIYAPSVFILGSASDAAQQFDRMLQAKAHRQLSDVSAPTIEALQIAAAALGKAPIGNTRASKAADRLALRDALDTFKSPQNAETGLLGPLYFDAHNNLPVPVQIGLFSGTHYVPAPIQYVAVVNPQAVDVEAEKTAGRIVDLGNGQLAWKQQVVYTGIAINQISRIDTSKESSFFADFHLWMRYAGGDVAATAVDFPDATSDAIYVATQPEEAKVVDGLNYRRYHIRGEFKATYDFHDFPFDQQSLVLRFLNTKFPRERVLYVVDEVGLDPRNDNTAQQLAQLRAQQRAWYVAGIIKGDDAVESLSKRGDLSITGSYATTAYTGFHSTVILRRNALAFLVKNLLPLALIALILYATLFFSVTLTTERLTIAITALLTSAVLLGSVNNQLSDASYTVAIEYLFYVFFALCLCTLIAGVARERFHQLQRDRLMRALDLSVWIGYPVTVAVVVAIYVIHYHQFFATAPLGGG